MRFLIDAQLPQRMKAWFEAAGCDVLHTSDLTSGNRSTDVQLNDVAESQERVIVTKDADFVDSHVLHKRPAKLLLVSTGNIDNNELESIVVPLVSDIVREFQAQSFLELGRQGLVIRG